MLQIGSQNTNFAVFTFVLLWATITSNAVKSMFLLLFNIYFNLFTIISILQYYKFKSLNRYILFFLQPMMSCEASRGTVKYVDRCPRNKSEWLESARNKNCSRINQNCSLTEFVYHCLINQWENATVEVCALRVNIIGKVFHLTANS